MAVRLETVDRNLDLDPRLQVTLDRFERHAIRAAFSSQALGEVAVVAIIKDQSLWEERTDFRLIAELGKPRNGKGFVVTGRVPLRRLPEIRADERVVTLKGAQQMSPVLQVAVPEIRADRKSLGSYTRQGEGVLVGIIDYGCDFVHRNFRKSDGTSRIEALWDQASIVQSPSDVDYGRVYGKAEIDAALKSAAPYATLGYDPDPQGLGMHGTHVMDIATGNGAGTKASGVAPNATILFVNLSVSDIPWTGEESLTTKLGDSVHLLEAVEWMFRRAGDRPCVVNVSLGTNGGPHDGSTPFEQGLDALVSAEPNRSVVIAAANSHGDRIHASGAIPSGGSIDLNWTIPIIGVGPNEMEVWYAGKDEFELELLEQDGTSVGTVGLPGSARITDDAGHTLVFVSHRKADPVNGDNMIGIFLEESVSNRAWTVRLRGKTIAAGGEFHAWIERNDMGQSSFSDGAAVNDSYTLGSLSCGHYSIAVASYTAHYVTHPISWFSSAGPTRDRRKKPEISAPGQDVVAARSKTETGVMRMSGTSMAAPAVTGAIAVMLSQAVLAGRRMTFEEIRDSVIQRARRIPPEGDAWDARYGNGRVDVSSMASIFGAGSSDAASIPYRQGAQAADFVSKQGAQAAQYVSRSTAEQPWAALLIAGAVGYVLAYLIRPRTTKAAGA